jgi:hypothetical protein
MNFCPAQDALRRSRMAWLMVDKDGGSKIFCVWSTPMSMELTNPELSTVDSETDSDILTEREALLRLNLSRLDPIYQPTEEQIAQWREATIAFDWVKSADGVFQRQGVSRSKIGTRAFHQRAVEPLVQTIESKCRSPIILEGIDPPWALDQLVRARPPIDQPNFRQRVLVLEDQWTEWLDGLASMDLGDGIGDPRFVWFVGPGASERLFAWVMERLDDAPPMVVVQNPLVRSKASPDGPELMRQIDARWLKNEEELIRQMTDRPQRSRAWWKSRFEQAGKGQEPLRVLIPTARHSTYLKYVAADIERAFTKLGCECLVQIEQDDSQMISKSTHLRTISAFDPDLIVLINYHRVSLSEHVPKDIPHVCWIQDAMPHLFEPQVGASLGEMDFVVGIVRPEMIDRLGYPEDRTRWMPMVASQSKFAGEPIDDGFDCEIAWVTHQSEHPSLFRARLIENMKQKAPDAVSKFEALLDRVEQMVLGIQHISLLDKFYHLVNEVFFPNGFPDDAVGLRSSMVNDMLNPYAERIFRHQTASWAANIAQRRGWRFKLYGNGWEKHPELGSFAAGPLEHGDDLRECYRRSVVQLHASVYQATHQRVSECLLAGGLPICRVLRQAFGHVVRKIGQDSELLYDEQLMVGEYSKPLYIEVESSPLAVEMIGHFRRLGLYDDLEFGDGKLKWSAHTDPSSYSTVYSDGGDAVAEMVMSHVDLFFTTETQLEALIEKAISDQAWRRERIIQGVKYTPKAMTSEGFVEQVLDMVRSALESSD